MLQIEITLIVTFTPIVPLDIRNSVLWAGTKIENLNWSQVSFQKNLNKKICGHFGSKTFKVHSLYDIIIWQIVLFLLFKAQALLALTSQIKIAVEFVTSHWGFVG